MLAIIPIVLAVFIYIGTGYIIFTVELLTSIYDGTCYSRCELKIAEESGTGVGG